MGERVYTAEQERTMAGSPALLWALLSDTNRWDRVVGCSPTTYHYEHADASDPAALTRIGHAAFMGTDTAWTEHGEWIESRLMWGERRFLAGPVPKAGYRIELTPALHGTRVRAQAYVAGSEGPPARLGAALRAHFEVTLERYLGAVERLLAALPPMDELDVAARTEPLAEVVARALLGAPADELHAGPVSACSDRELEYREERFQRAPVDPAVRARIRSHLRLRPDAELRQIRPFVVARAWRADRHEVLRGFLHAARAGLVDLRWQLDCPVCRVAADVVDSLEGVGKAAHCAECNADFAVDFSRNVEAVFTINAAVRKVEDAVYCGGSPWFRPHVFALLDVAPGVPRIVSAVLPHGTLLVRALAGRAADRAELVIEGEAPAEVVVHSGPDGVSVRASGRVAPGAASTLTFHHTGAHASALVLERKSWVADLVLGSAIVAMPEFLDLFATEAPAAGVDLSVGAITILFSDLTGTTALYEQLGDARAFALVQEHFRETEAAVRRHGGALVKTMGDAVMASFACPGDALAAAIEMVELVRRADGRHELGGLSIKLGLHHGPCLAVRANGRLDFFGTTVNVAARLQTQAHANQIVLLSELLAHPDVERRVREGGFGIQQFQAQLKGLRESQHLASIDPRPRTASVVAAAREPLGSVSGAM